MTDRDDADDLPQYGPTVADEWHRLRYTFNPTLFVDEDSTTNDLLWQLVLEQRAVRHWAALIAGLIAAPLVIYAVVVAVRVFS